MKIHIHFGIHRTGTTSIEQNLILNNLEVFQENGFLIPKLGNKLRLGKEEDIWFIVCGASKVSGATLKILEQIKDKEIKDIYNSIKYIIKKSIDYGGTTFMSFRGPEGKKGEIWTKLHVFRKPGEPCPHCKSPIKRIVVGQRGTHYCENKQKL